MFEASLRASRAVVTGLSSGTLQRGEQRRGEDLEGERRGHGVARRAEHRRGVHGAEDDRVAGPHRDAVHGERAGARDDPGGVVVAPRARTGDEHHQVGAGSGLAHRLGDEGGVVGDDRRDACAAPQLAGLRGEHERVGVEDLAGGGLRADGADLVAGRDDHDRRCPPDGQLHHPRRCCCRDVDRAQAVARGEQQLGGGDVLADRAHVLVRRYGGPHLGGLARAVHVFAHDHGVVAVGQRVPGVDDGEVCEQHGRRLGGAHGVGGPHGDPVHAGAVEGGGGAAGPHRLGRHPSDGLAHRHAHRVHPGRATGCRARVPPRVERLVGGHVGHERRVGDHPGTVRRSGCRSLMRAPRRRMIRSQARSCCAEQLPPRGRQEGPARSRADRDQPGRRQAGARELVGEAETVDDQRTTGRGDLAPARRDRAENGSIAIREGCGGGAHRRSPSGLGGCSWLVKDAPIPLGDT
jgi:hypothetical protein